MACVDKMPKHNEESEMEEGEIVDELDDLSDISSEEEFLLRQRLEVLENYNNVLERKKAKRSSTGPAGTKKREVLCDLSEISATELDDTHIHTYKHIKIQRHVKPYNRQKRRKEIPYVDENNVKRRKDNQKKKSSRKKKPGLKVIKESSDESEDEYKNKRKKLADAVVVHKAADKSTLSARLHKMIHWSEAHIHPIDHDKNTDVIAPNPHINVTEALSPVSPANIDEHTSVDVPDSILKDKNKTICDLIELSTDDEVKIISEVENGDTDKQFKIEEGVKECPSNIEKDSDEDLELLRQHALKSKPVKSKVSEMNNTEQKTLSEDEDSDTAELRLICLKSALLKKAIEMKQKQKMQKKLSQSSNLEDDLLDGNDLFPIKEDGNNTDIESVDMDMGSDADEKTKDCNGEIEKKTAKFNDSNKNNELMNSAINNIASAAKEEELDDDEDLLRAKLLTSLSKNLPNLVNSNLLESIKADKKEINEKHTPQTTTKTVNVPEAKKFIIKLGESDSEGEHEATKNLTKMHMKLSEQIDFQQKLDQFLKSTRQEVEKAKLPDVIQNSHVPKKPEKFVAKAVNHLPKSEQLEYKNLVRRMAELEKMKQTRQATLSLLNQQNTKDTLKQQNITISTQTINNNIEEKIAKSRKTIAEESAKMLKLKEEATKLSQKYKIAATELRNISTAITLNKKQQRTVQASLSKIRLKHQSLLKSSTTSVHSKVNGHIPHLSHLSNNILTNKLQKENTPKHEYKNPVAQKVVKVSVVNDFVDEINIDIPRLSVQLDVSSNTKVVKVPDSKTSDNKFAKIPNSTTNDSKLSTEKKGDKSEGKSELLDNRLCGNGENLKKIEEKEVNDINAVFEDVCQGNKREHISNDDYKSPLDALGSSTWQADPNAILCPFEVGGQCKDPDCKYLHTPTPAQ